MTDVLVGLSALCAMAYLVRGITQPPSVLRSALKTSAVAGLALAVWVANGPPLLVTALFFSALGDFLLSRETDKTFLGGMGAFFAAHVAYVVLFLSVGQGWLKVASLWPIGVGFLIYAALFYRYLFPGLGAFRVPVAAYSLAIAAMGLTVLGVPFSGPGLWTVAGALLFILSDSVLAADKFRFTQSSALRPFAPYIVWATYWAGQVLIALGIMAQ